MKHESPSAALPIEVAATAFAALGSEQRLSVLRTLVRAGPDGLSIGVLGARTGVTGSTLTHHMRVLTQAGLTRQTKRGRSVICAAADYEDLRALTDFLLSECCTDAPHDQGTHDQGTHDHG